MTKHQFPTIEDALNFFGSNPWAVKEVLGLDEEESKEFDELIDNVTDENTDKLNEYLVDAAELAVVQGK